MSKKTLRAALAVGLLVIILGLFVYYIKTHPSVIHVLSTTRPWLIIVLLLCYGLLMLCWMGVYNAILRLCGEPLKPKENLLLTIYSTLANFFLPLQSGPGVRAAYLNRRHKVAISGYLLSTLIYYGCYAVISAGLIFVASSYWWLILPSVIVATLVSLGVITLARNRFLKKSPNLKLNLNKKALLVLFALTLSQVLIQALIYSLELHSLHLKGGPRQYLSYTGAANFALFVALTPGAIGFREGFLKLSQSLHHFSNTAIIAANLIDRGVFLIFLGLMLIVMLATHARDKLKS